MNLEEVKQPLTSSCFWHLGRLIAVITEPERMTLHWDRLTLILRKTELPHPTQMALLELHHCLNNESFHVFSLENTYFPLKKQGRMSTIHSSLG